MEILSIPPFSVIGIAVRTINQGGQAMEDIGALWARLMSEQIMAAIPNKVDDTIYSIYTDYERDHTRPYTTILGCRVSSLDNVPEGMVGKAFDGGNYINLPAKGDLTQGAVGAKWGEIWQMDLNRAYTADFEVYGAKASDPTNAEVDILIAVK